jgi:murein DD-endopeptidase MepM/ murein hydrolase activator NlpD
MQIERLIREQIYLFKRRNKYRGIRLPKTEFQSYKRSLGIILVLVGIALLLSRCGKEEKKNTEFKESTQASVGQTEGVQKDYYAYVQDFTIEENTLQQLYQLALKNKRPFSDTLALWTIENYYGTAPKEIIQLIKNKRDLTTLDYYGLYEETQKIYSQFSYNLICFPIAKKDSYTFENGWKQGRTYKGARQHYGIDIMDPDNIPGKIKVFSITDGVVENIGWNEVGGYRVGIRTNEGAYFYYAHLDQNPMHIQKGDSVSAGDYIGDMGDTGYGKEGTRGEFPVHLHVGIAVRTKDNKEFWINPYYILKYLELKDFVYRA